MECYTKEHTLHFPLPTFNSPCLPPSLSPSPSPSLFLSLYLSLSLSLTCSLTTLSGWLASRSSRRLANPGRMEESSRDTEITRRIVRE